MAHAPLDPRSRGAGLARFQLGPGAATGVGSWPGTDPLSALRAIFDQLAEPPHLPHLPELPARGPGADLIGRSAALLVDLPVDLQPAGWRLVDHPGRDLNRARSFWRQDLDLLAEVADGFAGALKLQVAGPWTLAAGLRLHRLERVLADPGAVRDLVGSLAEGVRVHVAAVSALLPGARIVVQLDEPGLSGVLAGTHRTASGIGSVRAVEAQVVQEGLRSVLAAAVDAGAVGTAVHSCAPDVPVELLVRAGVGAISLDVGLLGRADWEVLAAAVEAGTALWAGAVPTSASVLAGTLPRPDAVADAIWTPWHRLGLDAATAGSVVITPACGLAGARTPHVAKDVVALAKRAGQVLAERAAG